MAIFSKFTPEQKSGYDIPSVANFQTANSTPQTNSNAITVSQAAKATGKFAQGVARGVTASASLPAVLVSPVINKLTTGKANFSAPSFTTSGSKAGRLFFGGQNISVQKEGSELIQAFGGSEQTAAKYGLPVGVALSAFDFTGSGRATKEGAKGFLSKVFKPFRKADEGVTSLPQFVNPVTNEKIVFDIPLKDRAEAARLIDGDRITTEGVAGQVTPSGFIPHVTAKNTKQMAEQGFTVKKATLDDVKAIISGESKERKFITRIKKDIPIESKIGGQYIPRSTDALAIKAKNLITSDITTAERLVRESTDENAVAVASELLNKYAKDAANTTDEAIKSALYDKAADIANTIAPKLTEQGRAIQAASIYGRLTPEGKLRFAAGEISRYNETVKDPAKRLALSPEDTRFIAEEQTAISQMPDGIEKAMRQQALDNRIASLVPSPLMQKIATVWKAGLLTGFRTQFLNIGANTAHFMTEIAKDVPATIVDRAVSLFTGQRTKTATVRNAFEGIKEGSIKGKRYFFTGFDEREIGAKLDYKRVNFGKGPVGKAFQFYTDTVFRTLGTQDQPYYYATLARSMMDQALADGINQGLKGKALVEHAYKIVENPTEEMIRYGTLDATTAVFQNKTTLGDAAAKIQRIPYVGEFIIPFGRTPSAVAMQIINYSPVGAVKTLFENIGKGKFDQRLFSQGIGRSITGTVPLWIGYQLYQDGKMTLDYPGNNERQIELDKAEGVEYNSVRVGDSWRSIMTLGPAGNLLLIGGHFAKALEEAGSPSEAFAQAGLGAAKSFTEQTFLTGLKNFVDGISDPERYAKSFLPNLVASFVPTLSSDIARAVDGTDRVSEGIAQRIQARIPVLREGLEPQVDIVGRDIELGGNTVETMFDPTRPSHDVSNPVTQELRRLMVEGYKVSPTKLGDKSGYKALSQEENRRLWEKTGEISMTKLYSLFSKPEYQALPDDQKAKVVDDVVQKAKDYSRAAMTLELTDGLEGEELRAKLSELKATGLLTRDVFRLYGELR